MTPYEQGFLTKCAEYGVDRNTASMLLKYAEGEAAQKSADPDASAGIGTFGVNDARMAMPEGSYTAALERNLPEKGWTPYVPGVDHRFGMPGEIVSQRALDKSRGNAANLGAQALFPAGSDPHAKVRESLIRAGQQNQDAYRSTGSVPARKAPDLTGLEGFELSPEQLEQLRIMQNTMARSGGYSRAARMA